MSFNLEQFIRKAQEREAAKLKYASVRVEYFDMDIPLKKIGMEKYFAKFDGVDEENPVEAIKSQKEIIYASMPILASEEIHNQFKVTEPHDIVLEIFNLDEIQVIMEKIGKLNGIDVDIEVVKNLSEQTQEHTTEVCS